MNHDSDSSVGSTPPREAYLAIILAVLVGSGAVVFLIFVSGGFFAWVLLIAAGIALFGGLHYLLWGRSFMEETEAERREFLDEQEAEAWRTNQPPWERRF